ncbi:MAG: PP2C family protein-serine/threonine phosphatase [Pseudorhodobacter sp.]
MPGALNVLVVDDSRAQRRMLGLTLRRAGYRVSEAASGEEALALCSETDFDIVLSDWMMTGMTGPEFCKAFRELPRESYGYFVLLTSKSEKAEVTSGLDGGADEFLTKPVNPDELRARLRAGERILGMQAELRDKNRLITATLDELRTLYDSLDRDLIEARRLQQMLVRERCRDFGRGEVSLLLRPSGHVGGDLVGFFEIDENRLGLYSVDVSGHGVASAMMTARLAGLLSGHSPDQNIAIRSGGPGHRCAWPPHIVAERFNRAMFDDIQVEQYFTLAYAEIDLATGRVSLVQAGHPHPAVLRACGRVDFLGEGGMPIGLIEGAKFETVTAQLAAGDRLFLVSDGVTECPTPEGEELGQEGLIPLLQSSHALQGEAFIEALLWDLTQHRGGGEFPDDVSGALFRYTP